MSIVVASKHLAPVTERVEQERARWLALMALVLAAACDSSSVQSSAKEQDASSGDACRDDTECPYWRCECRDGTVLEGAVCASSGCQNDAEVCADCVDHGGQGKTHLWDPGDWPDDAAPTVSSGGSSDASISSGGSDGGGGSSGAGAGSGGGSGQGGAMQEGALCPQHIACARAGSTSVVYEYTCEGNCKGGGSITLAPTKQYECSAFPGDFRPPQISAGGLEGVGMDVGSVGFALLGYGGGQGVPWGLKPQQDCGAPKSDDKIVAFDQVDKDTGLALGVVLPVMATCGTRTQPEMLLVAGTFSGWVCTDCPYYENGEYYAAFDIAFNLTDEDVLAQYQAGDTPKTKCTISGGGSFGGCSGPACTDPNPFP